MATTTYQQGCPGREQKDETNRSMGSSSAESRTVCFVKKNVMFRMACQYICQQKAVATLVLMNADDELQSKAACAPPCLLKVKSNLLKRKIMSANHPWFGVACVFPMAGSSTRKGITVSKIITLQEIKKRKFFSDPTRKGRKPHSQSIASDL